MAWTYAYSIAKEELHELIKKLGEDLKGLIADKVSPKRPIARQLRPQDIGLANPEWEITIPAGSTEVTVYEFDVPENKAIAIFGIASDEASIKELEIYAGSKRVAVIPLQDLYVVKGYGDYTSVKFLTGDDILKIPERTHIKIVAKVYPAPESDITTKLTLFGVIAEAEGETISL